MFVSLKDLTAPVCLLYKLVCSFGFMQSIFKEKKQPLGTPGREDNKAPEKIRSSALLTLMLEYSTIKNHRVLSYSIPVFPVAYTKIATTLPVHYGHKNRVRNLACSFYPSQITGYPYHDLCLV